MLKVTTLKPERACLLRYAARLQGGGLLSPQLRHATRKVWPALFLCGAASSVTSAHAEPNTHGPAVGSWGTQSSSVAFSGYGNALGRFHGGSFYTNINSASGESSGQFGFHYLNVRVTGDFPVQQGIGASGIFLSTFPGARVHQNGVAKTAFAFYAGGAPTALLRGFRNNLTFPIVLGVGVPISPLSSLTLTPWVEGSPSFNLDTTYQAYTFDNRGVGDVVRPDPVTGEGTISAADAQEFAEHGVGYEFEFQFGLRGGVATTLRLADSVDLNVNATVGSLGTAFAGDLFAQFGAGFVVHWGAAPHAAAAPPGAPAPHQYPAPAYPATYPPPQGPPPYPATQPGQPAPQYAPGQPYPPTQYYPAPQPYPSQPAQPYPPTQPFHPPGAPQPYAPSQPPPAQPAPGQSVPGQLAPGQSAAPSTSYTATPQQAAPYPPAQYPPTHSVPAPVAPPPQGAQRPASAHPNGQRGTE